MLCRHLTAGRVSTHIPVLVCFLFSVRLLPAFRCGQGTAMRECSLPVIAQRGTPFGAIPVGRAGIVRSCAGHRTVEVHSGK